MIPHCDIRTGKIYGCKRWSWHWWHEKGHIEFNNNPKTSRLKLWQDYVFTLWMFTITLSFFNKFMLVFALPAVLIYIGFDVYEEWWCNRYAKVKTNSFK